MPNLLVIVLAGGLAAGIYGARKVGIAFHNHIDKPVGHFVQHPIAHIKAMGKHQVKK